MIHGFALATIFFSILPRCEAEMGRLVCDREVKGSDSTEPLSSPFHCAGLGGYVSSRGKSRDGHIRASCATILWCKARDTRGAVRFARGLSHQLTSWRLPHWIMTCHLPPNSGFSIPTCGPTTLSILVG